MARKPTLKRRLRDWLSSLHPETPKSGLLGKLQYRLTDPRLWHINRHSVAKGAALGLFIAFIPLPIQALLACLGAILFRVNLPIAIVATWITNPFTFIPIIYLSYDIGSLFLNGNTALHLPTYVSEFGTWSWLTQSGHWLLTIGKPILIGTPIAASLAALLGYLIITVTWQIYLCLEIKRRKHKRRQKSN